MIVLVKDCENSVKSAFDSGMKIKQRIEIEIEKFNASISHSVVRKIRGIGIKVSLINVLRCEMKTSRIFWRLVKASFQLSDLTMHIWH